MNIEIHKPELVQRVQAQIQSGNFHDTDESIEKALDALDEKTVHPSVMPQGSLHEFFMNSPLRGANLDLQESQSFSCLDDVPSKARQAARQSLLARWFYAIALAPFSAVVFIGLRFFANSTSRLFNAMVGLTLSWAMGVTAYAFYLLLFMKCPRCGRRFGSGAACLSCKLPRHSDASVAAS